MKKKSVILISFLVLISSVVFGATITKGPWIQNVRTNAAVIMWETDASTTGNTVDYGTTTSYGSTASVSEDVNISGSYYVHTVEITGLSTYTKYYFRVNSASTPSKTGSLTTAPRKDSNMKIVIYGDSRTGTTVHQQICNSINAENASLVVHNGDYVGCGSDWIDWGDDFFTPASVMLSNHAFIGAVGNHEVANSSCGSWENNTLYYPYFSLPTNDTGAIDESPEAYFSYYYGDVHFIMLDSNDANDWNGSGFGVDYITGSPQLNWLHNELINNTSKWVIVVQHTPVISSAFHGQWTDDEKQYLMPEYEQYVASGGKLLVFNGDDHTFQHNRKDGVNYFVCGGAGASLYHNNYNTADLLYNVYTNMTYHYLTLDFTDNGDTITVNAHYPDSTVFYTTTFTTPPKMPTGLTLNVVSSNQIDLSWTDEANNEDSYEIYISQLSSQPGTPTASLPANSTFYSATGLTPGTMYFFWVTAKHNTKGESQPATAHAPTSGGTGGGTITIDGDLSDWPVYAYTNSDPANDDGCATDEGAADMTHIKMVDIDEKMYFAVTFGQVANLAGTYKEFYIYINSDNDSGTGNTGYGGADYRIRYAWDTWMGTPAVDIFSNISGTGSAWNDWKLDVATPSVYPAQGTDASTSGNVIELSVLLSEIGAPSGAMTISFQAVGQDCSWALDDKVPDSGIFSYTMIGAGDTSPPQIVRAENNGLTHIIIAYNENMGSACNNVNNYSIDNGIGTPLSAVVSGNTIDLTVPTLTANQSYTITITGNEDLAGNVVDSDSVGFVCDSFTIVADGDLSDWPSFSTKNSDPLNDVMNDGDVAVNNHPTADIMTNYFVANASQLYFAYRMNDVITNTSSGTDPGTGWTEWYIYIDKDTNISTGTYANGPYWVLSPGIGADYRIYLGIGASGYGFEYSYNRIEQWDGVTWIDTGEKAVVAGNNDILEIKVYKSSLGGISQDEIDIAFYDAFETTGVAPDNAVHDYNNDNNESAIRVQAIPPSGTPKVTKVESKYSTKVNVYFDKSMDVATVTTPGNYSLDGGMGSPASVTYNSSTFVATLNYSSDLTENQNYILTISSSVQDAWGNGYTDGTKNFTAVFMHPSDIILNEIMISPSGLDQYYEWFEIYNKGMYSIHMTNWIYNINGTNVSLPVIDINPGDIVVFAIDDAMNRYGAVWGGTNAIWGDEPCETYALYDYANVQMNDNQTFYLSDQSGYTDAVHINTSTANFSYEKISYTNIDSSSPSTPTILNTDANWHLCTNNPANDIYPNNSDAGTPGFVNSVFGLTVTGSANNSPIITGLTAIEDTDGSGNVLINYTGTDAENDTCTYVIAEYSTNNSTWNTMTADLGDARHNSTLNFTSSGASLNFVWDSKADLPSIYDGTVWVRFQVNDGTSNSAIVTSSSFVVDNEKPSAPTLISPLSNSKVLSTNCQLVWTRASDYSGIGVEGYVIYISNASFESLYTNNGQANTNAIVLLDVGTNYWQAIAVDSNGNLSNQASYWTVIVDTNIADTNAPADPNLVSPADNSFVSSSNQTLIWNSVFDASGIYGYIIAVSNSSGVALYTNTTGTNESVVLSEGLNKWSVIAEDNAGNDSPGNNEFSVIVDTIMPTSPSLISPANNSKITSTNCQFVWTKANDANGIDGYVIYISNASFTTLYTNNGQSNTNDTVILSMGANYWKVIAVDNAGNFSIPTSYWVVIVETPQAQNSTDNELKENTFQVLPNPLLSSQADSGMEIQYNATQGAEVKFEIYTMIGNLVTIIQTANSQGSVWWNGKNSGGKEVASGIYLMIMRVDGKIVYKPIKVGYIKR